MRLARYLSHPQVRIDPTAPVPAWGLSDIGRRRTEALAAAGGTLLYCHYAGLSINRRHDQPAGGGNYFTFRIDQRRVEHGWQPMERMAAPSE